MLPSPTYSNGRLTYDPATNAVTYGCVVGYAPSITGTAAQRICQSNNQWSGTIPTVTCTRKQYYYDLID